MGMLILGLVVIGTLFAIASGIWVAFALGSAISRNKKQKMLPDVEEV